MACALGLVRRGINSTIAEIDPEWRAAGMGLTLLGPTLRALDVIGVADGCAAAGFPQDRADFRNARGELTSVVPFPQVAHERLPAAVCITRPAFHHVLAAAIRAAGVEVRLGVGVDSLRQIDEAVEVVFGDGTTGTYDLAVGADGLHSRVRAVTFDAAPRPRFTGQAVWRTLVPRPAGLDVYQMVYGRRAKVGLVPVSPHDLYVFVVQNVRDATRPPTTDRAQMMSELLDAESEYIDSTRTAILDVPEVAYNPTEAMLVPPPWHRGRIVLVGDAAHTTTPHLAFGAGIAIEDAIVLCELVDSEPKLEQALRRYTEHRYARCRLVVENSVQLSLWEQEPGNPDADPVRLTRESWTELTKPLLPEEARR